MIKQFFSTSLIFIIFTFFFVSNLSGQIDLIAHYMMDGNAQDVSGKNNHGTIYGATSASDRFGDENRSFYFDGQNDYIIVPNSPSLNPTDAITVSAWYKTTPFAGGGNDGIVNKAYTSHIAPYYQYQLGVGGNQYTGPGGNTGFGFSISLNDQYLTTSTGTDFYSLYTWYFVVGTYDGSNIKLYINGNLISTKPAIGKMRDYGSDLYIGRHKNINNGIIYHLPGTIDDVRIYNIALTQQEITNLFNTTSPVEFNFSIEGDCINSPVNFNYLGFSDYDSIRWHFGDNSSSVEKFPSHTYKNSGEFEVLLNLYYNDKKYITKNKIIIKGKPVVKLGRDTTLCPGALIHLDAGNQGNSYLWNNGATQSAISVNKPSNYSVMASNNCGISGDTIAIRYSEFKNIYLPIDTITCRNYLFKIEPSGPDSYRYIWNNMYESKEYQFFVSNDISVNLLVIDSNNCNKTFQTNIRTKECLEDIIIPNVFTPNGDGLNDFWVIENMDKYPNASVEVFNRWGEQVYKSIGYSDPWDGLFNGKHLSPGCYFYIIILNSGKEAYSGPVMIYSD